MITRRFASRTAVLAAGVLLCLLSACGGGDADGLLADPKAFELGEVVFRDVLERTLTLTNRTRQPIYLQSVTPSCACLKVGSFLRSIEPGESRKIHVVLDTHTLPPGPLKKALDVAASPPSANTVIRVEANIVHTHDSTPNFIELGTLNAAGREARPRIELRPRPGVEMRITRVEATPAALEARIERLEKGADVTVGIRAEAPPGTGRLGGRLRIHVDVTLPSGAQRTRIENVPVEGTWP